MFLLLYVCVYTGSLIFTKKNPFPGSKALSDSELFQVI